LRYLLAVAVGGLAGGLLRHGLKRGNLKHLLLDLLLGVVAGALIFGLYALGVNLTGFQLPRNGGELLVAVVAALGAFGGARLLQPKSAPST
jgi:ABC-type thiamin/hydroxymethylpyrimidine transport system permease subunit